MKIEVKHSGIVKNGKKIYDYPHLYEQQLQSLEGQEFVEIIKKKHVKVTQSQHAYYRGGILITCYQTEMFNHLENKDKIHDLYFAKKFLTHKELVVLPGEQYEVEVTRHLPELSKQEMSDFIERVLAECAELEIEILPPEMYYSKYYNINRTQ